MADDADRAAEFEQMIEEKVLAGRPRLPHRFTPGTDCMGCGLTIPAERRLILPGCCLCVECQDDAERAMGR